MPNPASQHIKLTALSQKVINAKMTIINATGQKVFSQYYRIAAGYSTITIPVIQLAPGLHRLFIEGDGVREAKTFIRN
jgi:hypothetical protein